MTILGIVRALKACGDATVWKRTTDEGVVYDVTLESPESFSDEWDEIGCDYAYSNLIDTFLTMLEEQALYAEGDLYCTYYFEGFRINLNLRHLVPQSF